MTINYKILDQVQAAGAQLVAVTKYLDAAQTAVVMPELMAHPAVCGLGENRVESLESKNLPREQTHFIGRLQSRRIPQIVQNCAVIHSLDQLSHANKINVAAQENDLMIKIFVQINISQEPQKGGIDPEELPAFLEAVAKLESCEVMGLSGMGSWLSVGGESAKRAEFKLLQQLREEQLPQGLLSAGTSSDYQIALESGVDIVRIGRSLF